MDDDRFGRYRLVRHIGSGGMAEVFRAELVGAEGVTRALVVKKVRHALSLDREAVDMFVEEARVAASLHHPNIVQVYEFGRAGDGYFLAMELVDGCDLATLLRDHVGVGLPGGAAAWVFLELLDALGYVHGVAGADGRALGLVHRDVSPHNVLIGRAGEVKLADFGIATATARLRDDGVKGKFAYMSPEQARGDTVDARADLFAVGAMLYEALSGRRMYATRDADALHALALRAEVEPLEHVALAVHPSVAAVVARAVAADREHRFSDARSFREALSDALFVAGITPDREALRQLVRSHTEQTTPPRPSEPTLTAQGDVAVPEVLPDERVPARVELPRLSPRSRRVLERVGIAIGIFTLAVLAERRTRPHPPNAVLRVALPDDAGLRAWFEGEASAEVARRCHRRVVLRPWRDAAEVQRLLRDGAVDVAGVTTLALPQLVAAGAVASVTKPTAPEGLRGPVARVLTEAGYGDGRWFAPVGVDAVVMAVHAGDVREDVAAARPMLEAALSERTGTGLPAGYAYAPDPAAWSWWDVLSFAWRPGGRSATVAITARGEGALSTWIARAESSGASGPRAVRSYTNDPEAIVESSGWNALLHAVSVVRDEDGTQQEPSRVTLQVGPARALTLDGAWTLHPPPRGDAWLLDADRRPRSVGRGALVVEVLGWVAARGAQGDGALARCLQTLSGAALARGVALAWRGVPAAEGGLDGARPWLSREAALMAGATLTLAVGATQPDVAGATRAYEALRTQGQRGEPSPFVGEGRWWVSTLREAVAQALRTGVDGGAL